MRKRILCLGGAYAQIPIIKEAKKRNYYIITCDYLPENPGHRFSDEYFNVSTTDYQGILKVAKKVNPDFLVAYASDPAAPIAAYVSEQLGLPSNSYQSVKILSEKDLFRNFLIENSFNTPKHFSLSRNNYLEKKIYSWGLPIIIKPTDSSGSKGVSRVDHYNQIEKAISYAFEFSRNNRIIIEEFIDSRGKQLHGDGFVLNGKLVFSSLGDHWYDSECNPFVPYATTWPSETSNEIIKKVELEVARVIQNIGLKNGPINIEARIDIHGKIFIMEIGPRSGGNFVPQILNYITNFNMVKALLDVLENKIIEIPDIPIKHGAYYVIHSNTTGTLSGLSINSKISPFIKEFHQYINLGEKVIPFTGANAAIGILLLTFNNREEMKYYIKNMKKFITLKILKT
ncbi:ATP-grasp domain-containing protein [Methylomarinum vadi]|uniref:ATP-grasp domain-containing protein n=1 Tax=Methylomarinum vadi TaxID=438855 RepID=UPI0004DFB0BE|nr:ATP-grasp domain-containing protein [Methylomarinum vadi]